MMIDKDSLWYDMVSEDYEAAGEMSLRQFFDVWFHFDAPVFVMQMLQTTKRYSLTKTAYTIEPEEFFEKIKDKYDLDTPRKEIYEGKFALAEKDKNGKYLERLEFNVVDDCVLVHHTIYLS